MSVVVDASVLVAAHRVSEPHHAVSTRFLERVQDQQVEARCPALVLPECASAIIRGTEDPEAARAVLEVILSFPRLTVDCFSIHEWQSAAEAAIACKLRGGDAAYVALAARHGAELITWDSEMLTRGAAMVRTATPEQWLSANPAKPSPDDPERT
jgi:predicted nucleic acid-binding protein